MTKRLQSFPLGVSGTLLILTLFAEGCASLFPTYAPPYTPIYTPPAANKTSEAEYQASQNEERARINSWVGHTRTELLEGWGPPTSTIEDGGRQVLVYDQSNTILIPPPAGMSGPILPVRTGRYVMFWLDEEGAIYKITWKGH